MTEPYDCPRCRTSIHIGDGLEPSKYCNTCAHDVVEELEAKLNESVPLAIVNKLAEALVDCIDGLEPITADLPSVHDELRIRKATAALKAFNTRGST